MIFCGNDEECLSRKCYKKCKPECTKNEKCVIDTENNIANCVKLEGN